MQKLLTLTLLLCSYGIASGQSELQGDQFSKLLPENVKGFSPLEAFKVKKLKLGTLTYTVCEKKFTSHDRSIAILLFDFGEAKIMYNQAMQTWSNGSTIETDSLIHRPVVLGDSAGWESFQRHSGTSQIALGIANRFYLNIKAHNVNLEQLKGMVEDIDLAKFPK